MSVVCVRVCSHESLFFCLSSRAFFFFQKGDSQEKSIGYIYLSRLCESLPQEQFFFSIQNTNSLPSQAFIPDRRKDEGPSQGSRRQQLLFDCLRILIVSFSGLRWCWKGRSASFGDPLSSHVGGDRHPRSGIIDEIARKQPIWGAAQT